MTALQTIADTHAEAASHRLLVIGRPGNRVSSVIEGAEILGCFASIVHSKSDTDDWAAIDDVAQAKGLYAGLFRECLVIVWDLEPIVSTGRLETFLDTMANTQDRRPRPGRWSPQVVCFGLVDRDFPLGFRACRKLIEREFAGIGDPQCCLSTLDDWCRRKPEVFEGGLSLRHAFTKQPSHWIFMGDHDFGNAVRSKAIKLEEAGLGESRRRLQSGKQRGRTCSTPWGGPPPSIPIPRRIGRSIPPPSASSHPGSWQGLARTRDGRGARTSRFTRRAPAQPSALGNRPHRDWPVDWSMTRPKTSPRFRAAMGRQGTCRSSWSETLNPSARGRAGPESCPADGSLHIRTEFLSERFDLDVKRGQWRPFCFLTLAQSFELTINVMVQSYSAALRPGPTCPRPAAP